MNTTQLPEAWRGELGGLRLCLGHKLIAWIYQAGRYAKFGLQRENAVGDLIQREKE